MALQNGVDVKTVSTMLGHYDAGFTLRTYTHATRQKQDEAVRTMGGFMTQAIYDGDATIELAPASPAACLPVPGQAT